MADPHAPLVLGGGWQQVEETRQWRARACARAVLWTLPLAAGATGMLIAGASEPLACWMWLGFYGLLLLGTIGFRLFEKPMMRTVERRLENTNKNPDVLY